MKTYYEKSLRFKELKTSKVQTAGKAGGKVSEGTLLGLFCSTRSIGSGTGSAAIQTVGGFKQNPEPEPKSMAERALLLTRNLAAK